MSLEANLWNASVFLVFTDSNGWMNFVLLCIYSTHNAPVSGDIQMIKYLESATKSFLNFL